AELEREALAHTVRDPSGVVLDVQDPPRCLRRGLRRDKGHRDHDGHDGGESDGQATARRRHGGPPSAVGKCADPPYPDMRGLPVKSSSAPRSIAGWCQTRHLLAETTGFEPVRECYPPNRLAGGCFRPLSHV